MSATVAIGLQEAASLSPAFVRFGLSAALVLLVLLLGVCGFQLWILFKASRREEEPEATPKAPEPSGKAQAEEVLQALRALQKNLERSLSEEGARTREETRAVVAQEFEKARASYAVCPAAEAPEEVPAPAPTEAGPSSPPWPGPAKEILHAVKDRAIFVSFNTFLGVFEKKEGGALIAVAEGDGWFLVPGSARLEDAQAFQDLYAEAFHPQGLMARGSLYVVRPAGLEEVEGKEGRFKLLEKGALSIQN